MRHLAFAAIGGCARRRRRARSNGTSCRWPRASSASTTDYRTDVIEFRLGP